jgi:collagen type III alpha
MSEKVYEAMRAYVRSVVELEVLKVKQEMRSALPTETRAAEPIPGPKGDPGAPSTVPGPKGDKGDPGLPGKDGIGTRQEIESIVEQRVADLQVRTFADSYREVYKPGELYKRGEFVTWGGSLFLAKADTQAKPEQSPDWKLVVKRGADGRK